MGKIKKGILGGFSGIVGTVVGSSWNGIEYIRSRPTISKSKASTAQVVQRARFSIASKFLRSMKDLLAITYLDYAGKMTGANSALRYTLKNAVSGVYPDLQVDYNMAIVSRGSLPVSPAMQVVPGAAGAVRFQWTDNSGIGAAKATDKAILVAYCEELDQCVYTIGPALRSAGNAELPLSLLTGKEVHTWLAFISENGKDTASSVYTGSITVS